MGSISHRPPAHRTGPLRTQRGQGGTAAQFMQRGRPPAGVPVAIVSCQDHMGRLHSRPLALLDLDDQGQLWFFLDADEVDEAIGQQGRVRLAFSDPEDEVHVSIVGRARLIRDRARLAQLWRLSQAGPGTPRVAHDRSAVALCVAPDDITCWDGRVAGGYSSPAIAASLVSSPTPPHRGVQHLGRAPETLV